MKGAGFGGAFGMGLVAGVVAAPCTGPVLAGVLAFVATSRSLWLGFWLLFTYALGLGLLFFVLGTTSVRLPRSGGWMEQVKSLLGAALIAIGVSMLLQFVPHAQRLPLAAASIALVSGLAAFVAALAGALRLSFHGPLSEKLQKGYALALLLAAVALRFGWFGEPRDAVAAGAPEIAWLTDEKAALEQARASNKGILIDFSADWCAACHELDKLVFSDPEVRRTVAEKYVPLRVMEKEDDPVSERLEKKYAVQGLPTVLMLACKDPPPPAPAQLPPDLSCQSPGEGRQRVIGFVPAKDMLDRLRSAR